MTSWPDARPTMPLVLAARRLLPGLAILAFGVGVAVTIAAAGDTLGYDFLAYHSAATRVLDGQTIYDTSYRFAGGFGLFYYPPTFVPLVLAFGLLSTSLATALWIGVLLAAFAGGIALLPVSRGVRWLILLLAAQSWPFLYALKLGQVGPLLFLLFVAGWRWLDRQPVAGGAAALGAAIKIQPGLIFVWAVLTHRWRLVVSGVAVLAVLGLLGVLLAGTAAWPDYLSLIGQVSEPVSTPHNMTPGAVAFQAGVSPGLATAIQWGSMVLVTLCVVVAAWRLDAAPSYLVAVVASQLLSPILWDHYAMLLLIPVAWLLDRGRWWAAAIPLATSVLLLGLQPAWVYPVVMWASIAAILAVAWHARGRDSVLPRPGPIGAGAIR